MKILFVLENTIKDLHGGTEVSSWHIARLLRKDGIEVEEWSPFEKRRSMFWYTNIFSQIGITILLLWKLVKNRVQIIHVQGKYLIPPAVLVGKILKIPLVVTIRDYIVVCPIGLCLFDPSLKGLTLDSQGQTLSDNYHGFNFFFRKEVPRFLSLYHPADNLIIRMMRYILLIGGWFVTQWLQFWLKRTDVVVSVSQAVRQILQDHGISSRVIHNSFDTEFAEKVRPFDRLRVRPLNIILFVGKPSYGKGYDFFLALSRVKEFKNFEFKTVGGSFKLSYEDTIAEMARALVVVVPSRWQEPFGRVALESLMVGTPVVATRCGGLREVVKDKMNGVIAHTASLHELSTALSWALSNNRTLRDTIERQSGILIKNFSQKPTAEHTALYESLSKTL